MGRLRYIRLTRRQRVRVWLAIILLALTALLAAILLHLRPMLENLATARCANTVSRIVVAAVNDALGTDLTHLPLTPSVILEALAKEDAHEN